MMSSDEDSIMSSGEDCIPLIEAARAGRLADLQRLVAEGDDLGETDSSGCGPLHEVADRGYIDCLDYILAQSGIDINCQNLKGVTALHLACIEGHVQVVQRLLEKGANPNISTHHSDTSPLHSAVRANSLAIVKLLVMNNANVNSQLYCGTTALHDAITDGHTDIVRYLVDNGADISMKQYYDITPLYLAAENGQEDSCKIILEKAAKLGDAAYLVNVTAEDGASALYMASEKGNATIIKQLLAHGASANLRTEHIAELPLHAALERKHADCVRLLLPHTDKTLFPRCQVSLFHYPLMNEDLSCTRALLDGGISPCQRYALNEFFSVPYNTRNLRHCQDAVKYNKHVTPLVEISQLTITTTQVHINLAELFLEAGAPVNARKQLEVPPLLAALERKHYNLAEILIQRGAEINMYHPKVITNMAIITTYTSWTGLNLVLQRGAEAKSMFTSSPHEVGVLRNPMRQNPVPFWRILAENRMSGGDRTVFEMLHRVLQFVGSVRLDQRFQNYVDSREEWRELCAITDSPRSLTHLCRLMIREYMGTSKLSGPHFIESLPLPEPVTDFLLYKDLC